MTNEQAAKILDPDSSKDALAAISYYAGFGGEEAELAVIRDACRLAVIALRHTNIGILSCAGCDYLDRDNVPCAHCVRSAGYADYYKKMDEPK